MFIRNSWYTAAWAHEVGETPLARRILNEPVVLFRDRDGTVAALRDSCCHRGAPLSGGKVVDGGIECGYHGLVFDCSGTCVHIPGQESIPKRARVPSYAVIEKDKMIWIWMGDPKLADVSQILSYPYHNSAEQWPHKMGIFHVKASYMLLVDNLMDLTHVGYVHTSTLGGTVPTIHTEAKMEVESEDTGLRFTRWMLNSAPPPTFAKAYPFKGNVDRWQHFRFVAPGHIVQHSGAKDVGTGATEGDLTGGFSARLFHALTPETETSCHYFWSVANDFQPDDPRTTQLLFDQLAEAFNEDKCTIEGQQERLTELGQEFLVDIVSDRARISMRRTVDRMLEREKGSAPGIPS